MKIQFTDHVKYRILERGIDVSQIKTVLKNPDSNKFAFNNKMKATKKLNGRTLEVVYIKKRAEVIIVTAYYI